MTWALRRQLFYVGILVVIFGLMGFWIGYPYLNKEPTCSDGKQNGTEMGVDCGGSCSLVCAYQADRLSVLWQRAFRVVPGRYNAVAYIENYNENAIVPIINYRFRFADANNIYIGKREGRTYLPSAGKFAIFEPAIDLGNSVPVYTTFEFTQTPVWYKVSADVIEQLKLFVKDIILEDEDTNPRLSAKVKNNSLLIIPNVDVVAILYDELGNALNVSKTFIEELKGEEEKEVIFTWPEPMSEKVVTKEIIPIYNISEVKFK